ncbi:FAST kinase domain-containing protein 4 [Anopheles ziemanni]|uniref:FAST kinase domain-containing protein 4 n=1 Tax=Anopheles coustani TaxID=139045 RepID=UPI00265B2F27|nr:FAST kinase domain-containing protein 4 [Anopheles coustani]XP_058130160.1 FAST kinase domain-containing protein 4 [Anopheles coustani]XP_058171858.1 FAST kinase domain-containing protein 4 [Anopheles ziemanni]XP_058171859.1 FAST kinase domain-containing protein 4 [Anopheles ziemanni]
MMSLRRISRSIGFCLSTRGYSISTGATAAKVLAVDANGDRKKVQPNLTRTAPGVTSVSSVPKNPIVAAAFASLRNDEPPGKDETPAADQKQDIQIDEMILKANTVTELLAIADVTKVNRKQALKIVSILAEWSSIKKANLSEFESDPRFVELCSLLGRTGQQRATSSKPSSQAKQRDLHVDDLQTVLGITANDEAAKLIAGLTLPQMIKVMSSLAMKKKRSIPLLRSLSFNIASNPGQLNLKECGDMLYAMASLNYRDVVLTARICSDLEQELAKNTDKIAPIVSILTSLGMLRYRDGTVLDNLTSWIAAHHELCKPTQLGSLLLSLATLNYEPISMDAIKAKLVVNVTENDFIRSADWLNTVWSLTVLNSVTGDQLSSVLNPEFFHRLQEERRGSVQPSMKMKLLNLAAAAKRVPGAKELLLAAHQVDLFVPFEPTKEKRVLITGMLDALKSLIPSESMVKISQATTMGFTIDAECVLDKKCLPLPVDKEHEQGTRIALLVHDYHDMCQGPHAALNGMQILYMRLLEQRGYTVLSIPYSEFNTSDKLLKRVEYLQKKFKSIVTSKQ